MASYPFHTHLLLLLSLSFTFLHPSLSDLAADRSALLRLQTAVRGRTLLWNTTSPTPCSWTGVTCDNTTNRVIQLRLPGCGLTGQLPPNTIGNLTELRVLSLRRNSLSGPIPPDLASCTQLRDLFLQENRFSGEIPENFFTLRNLARVSLAGNRFSGNLPSGFFTALVNLRILTLENNQFAGALPNSGDINRIQLRQFNISFNRFITGSIPSSFSSFSSLSFLETSLCGTPLPPCPENTPSNGGDGGLSGGAIAGISVGAFSLLVSILIILFISWRRIKQRKTETTSSSMPTDRISHRSPIPPAKPPENEIPNQESQTNHGLSRIYENGEKRDDGLVFFWREDEGVFSMEELLRSSAEVMGKGTVGSTYKAYMENGVEVIVKRLKNVCVSEREFRDRMMEMGALVHENLEKARGYFYGRDEKLLVYNPMGIIHGQSLFEVMHGDNKQPLSWEIRARTALGVARGIEHLHSISTFTTHGNIKSSNVFLTGLQHHLELGVRVSEFGLTPLVSSISNLSGYRAPEVTNTRKISQSADVYSFGIMLLELLTGKEPDHALTEEGIQLPKWVQSVVRDKWTVQVFDPELVRYENLEEEMVQILHLAVSCTAQHPERRPPMVEVRQRIEEIIGKS